MVKLALAKTVYSIFDSYLVLGKLKTEIDQKINTYTYREDQNRINVVYEK